MKNPERDLSSKSSTDTSREKEETDDIDGKRIHSASRKVLRSKKNSSEIESSEKSNKREKRRSRRSRKRNLKRDETEIEETTETGELFSPISKKSSRSSTNTSRKRRQRLTRTKGNIEIPIAETLSEALDKEEHADYYNETANFSTLTTDKIYVQGKNGFSAIRIPTISEEDRGYSLKSLSKDIEGLRGDSMATTKEISAPISIAIVAQKCWKRTALVYQGLLAGMALVHLTMVRLPLANLRKEEKNIRVFFDTSMEFVSRYSLFSEIYRSLFSLMIALSVTSIFDKFDIAHLKLDRLNDIRGDYIGSVITIPLYVATLCLHETFANVDDRLALIHYRDFNCSLWNNSTTNLENFLDGLATWQKINISKDLLAVLSWFLVAVGKQDDMLLMNLETMQEYRSDMGTPYVE